MKRRSQQREEIRDILKKKNFHPTAEELNALVREKIPGVGIATVYRNLEKLVQNGEVVRVDFPGEPSRVDGNIEKHCHFRCVSCGKVEDVWMDVGIDRLVAENSFLSKAEVLDHTIQFSGLCPACKHKKN